MGQSPGTGRHGALRWLGADFSPENRPQSNCGVSVQQSTQPCVLLGSSQWGWSQPTLYFIAGTTSGQATGEEPNSPSRCGLCPWLSHWCRAQKATADSIASSSSLTVTLPPYSKAPSLGRLCGVGAVPVLPELSICLFALPLPALIAASLNTGPEEQGCAHCWAQPVPPRARSKRVRWHQRAALLVPSSPQMCSGTSPNWHFVQGGKLGHGSDALSQPAACRGCCSPLCPASTARVLPGQAAFFQDQLLLYLRVLAQAKVTFGTHKC